MKLKFIDRLLIGLFSLIGFVLVIAVASSFLFHGSSLYFLEDGWNWVIRDSLAGWGWVVIVACAVILLAWSVKILSIALRRGEKIPTSVAVQSSENGSVRISVEALDTLIRHALEHQEGIKHVKSKVINHEDSISVAIEMSLTSDVNIPNITLLLQQTVKKYIEEYSGIAVREVTVMISSIVEVVPLPLALESKPAPIETYEVPTEEPTIEQEQESLPIDAVVAEAEAEARTENDMGSGFDA